MVFRFVLELEILHPDNHRRAHANCVLGGFALNATFNAQRHEKM